MSERKITAPGPGWRMPGKAKSTNIRDAMPNLLNAMGDSIERSNKMDFGLPGVHTQNGFQQPFEQSAPGPLWILLSDVLPAGTYSEPSSAYGIVLTANNPGEEQSLQEGTDEIKVWNYSFSFSANAGDWVMAIPFNGVYVAIPSAGGSQGDVVLFDIVEWFPNADPSTPICDCILATVTTVQCGSRYAVGDEVLIADTCGWLSIPIELLIGASGRAESMETAGLLSTLTCPSLLVTYGVGDCILTITSPLCCTETDAYLG